MNDRLQKEKEEIVKLKELRTKENILRESRVEREFEKLEEYKRQQEILGAADISQMDPDEIASIQTGIQEYLEAARTSKTFINDTFRGIVPLFAKNVILIGANSGEGKSTISANVTLSTLKQSGKVLILTNEENKGDIYNRVTCLIHDWNYQGHEKFSETQVNTFKEYVGILSKKMVVLDDRSVNKLEGGDTTTYEGIANILENLIQKNIKYDLIILDYFQNVASSKKNPQMNTWEVQAKLANYLDNFKNRYQAPVIVLAQLRPAQKDAEISFEDRLKGRKKIYETCTFACEARANKAESTTEWVVHKSRFGVSLDKGLLKTGWERGRYVPLDAAWLKKQEEKAQMGLVGTNEKETK